MFVRMRGNGGQVIESVWTDRGSRQRIVESFDGPDIETAIRHLRANRHDDDAQAKANRLSALLQQIRAAPARARRTASPAPAGGPQETPKAAGASSTPRPAPASPARPQSDEIAMLEARIARLIDINDDLIIARQRLEAQLFAAQRGVELKRLREELAAARARITTLERRPPEAAESETVRRLETVIKGLRTRIANLAGKHAPANLSEAEITQLLKVCHPDKTATVADRTAVTQLLLGKRDAIRTAKKEEAAKG